MDHSRYLGRCIAVGVGALVLSGAGIASATTPTEPSDDTAMATTDTALGTSDTAMGATSEPMTGGGPSDCPPIPEAPATRGAART